MRRGCALVEVAFWSFHDLRKIGRIGNQRGAGVWCPAADYITAAWVRVGDTQASDKEA